MKRKTLILPTLLSILFCSLVLLPSCNKRQLSRRETARMAAEQYYTFLINGQYESFAKFVFTPDSMPTEYRVQLAQAVKQYAENDTRSHGGIVSATAIDDSLFADSTQAIITLQLKFGDQTFERIHLPLVFTADGWKMR